MNNICFFQNLNKYKLDLNTRTERQNAYVNKKY